uniref:Matrix-remodeling-associated protein 7 helical domain-containing protein n=1 Tax=Plectus sambesii TaxID=2011161 RepID=A0A914XQS4_9BILA
MQRLDKLTQELQEDEVSYSLDELGELHGKLMTADLRNKAKKYEAQMTEEQRQSEAEIRQQQLESIFALMQQQQDKFGSPNEGDIVEQMKLYAL